jgi:hypothetical protein
MVVGRDYAPRNQKSKMNTQEVLENLCVYDAKHPSYADFVEGYADREPRNNCYCDNCFYGRDKMAVFILSLLKEESL